jgi:hypothetical protein
MKGGDQSMSDKPTVEELCEQLEQVMTDRHSREIKLWNGAVWRVERIKLADR